MMFLHQRAIRRIDDLWVSIRLHTKNVERRYHYLLRYHTLTDWAIPLDGPLSDQARILLLGQAVGIACQRH